MRAVLRHIAEISCNELDLFMFVHFLMDFWLNLNPSPVS